MRSESKPGYYRTASRGRYMRDSSKYGGRSHSRPNGNARPYRDGSRIRSLSRGRNPQSSNGSREKSAERPKSNLEKKVESIEKEISTIKQSVSGIKKIEEMLKKVTINTQFVEEEISIDIKYVQRETDNSMIIDSGAPVSLVSNAWLKNYMEEAKVGDESIKQESNSRRFRLGKTLYISTKKVTFPIVMKTDDNDLLKREVTANVIESNEVNFLCGDETLKGWKMTLDFEEEKLGFKECKKTVQLERKSHLVVQLQLVGTWNEDEAVFLVQNEKDIKSFEAVRDIHRKLNHKSKEQMLYAFRNANKLDPETRRNIEKVLEVCEICKKNKRSASKPAVAIPRATDFNSVVSLDLKSMAGKHILWMVCTFTKFIKGAVLKDKTPESIINALHQGWCMEVGFPTVGWWSDNGGEFRNSKMEEYVAKMGLTINFTPSYSPYTIL